MRSPELATGFRWVPGDGHSDKTYVQMLEKGKDFWVPGSVRDQVFNFLTS